MNYRFFICFYVTLILSTCRAKSKTWLQRRLHNTSRPYMYIEKGHINNSTCARDMGTECYYAGEDLIKVAGFFDMSKVDHKSSWSRNRPLYIHRILYTKNYNISTRGEPAGYLCSFWVQNDRDCQLKPPDQTGCWCTGSSSRRKGKEGSDLDYYFTYKGRVKAQAEWSQDGIFLYGDNSEANSVNSKIVYLPKIYNRSLISAAKALHNGDYGLWRKLIATLAIAVASLSVP